MQYTQQDAKNKDRCVIIALKVFAQNGTMCFWVKLSPLPAVRH
jgi:hypothetical protein